MPMLVADSLTATRFGKPLFKELGFCLLYGSLTVLLGRNNKARQELLAFLAGGAAPQKGMVRFEGQPVLGHDEYRSLVARIGLKHEIKGRLSVLDNIRGFVPPSGSDALASAAMEYFRLAPDRPCYTLPLHMQRRVAYARLLAVPCPIWLIEHRQETLDAEGNELLYMLISNRCNQDGIVVIATEKADFISPNLPLDLDDFV